ncbi:MAG: hypothetical protein HY821_02580, partial [Acidobacteria bacterium]|nr:hypothetical protein [Acidobacteriota bacterium]
TLRYSYSRSASVGHLVKSRAASNYILYNRLTQESGSGSYELDLPNAGLAYVIGNILQQGDSTQNRGMLSYGMEALSSTTPNQLYAVNNTFVSTRAAGATFVQVGGSVPLPAEVRNNIFSGDGIVTTQGNAILAGNVTSGNMGFANPAQYDYHLTLSSAALNAGVDPGQGGAYPLRPVMQYYHPLCGEPRSDVGLIDAGAFEFGLPAGTPVCAPGVNPPPEEAVLTSVTVSPVQVISGAGVTGTVTLSAAAGPSGAVVGLSSSAPAAAPVPASVTVPSGQSSASFSISTGGVAVSTAAVISATLNATTLTATLTVDPKPVLLAGLSLSPLKALPGTQVTATLRLAGPAPAGGLTAALAAPAELILPPTVTVPAGASSVSFPVPVAANATGQMATISAIGANTVTARLYIVPLSEKTGR